MGKPVCLLILIFHVEFLSIFFFTLVDLREFGVFGHPVKWTKQDICQVVPSPVELAAVPHSVPLENTTFAPFFLYKQKLELVDYVPHKTVLISTIEDPDEPVGIYIPEARLPDAVSTPFTDSPQIGRFKSPSSEIQIYRCADVDISLVMERDDVSEVDDRGVTLEWHPPSEDVGPVDIYITKISFKKLRHRLRRAHRQP